MGIKVSMISLGCSKNQIDAEILLADMQKNGFEITTDVSQSDLVDLFNRQKKRQLRIFWKWNCLKKREQ